MTTGDLRPKGYAIQVLLDRGLERYRTGATTLALAMWEEALAIDPDEPRALTYIDYVRQNWDEVDGCVEPPVPDVSDLVPNYPMPAAAEPVPAAGPAPVATLAPVVGPAPAPVVEAARLDAVPDPIHDAPTPRGTIEHRRGGVAGDGWGLAPESLLRPAGPHSGEQAASPAPATEPMPAPEPATTSEALAAATVAATDELPASLPLTPLASAMPELAGPTPDRPLEAPAELAAEVAATPAVALAARVPASDVDFDRDLEDALGAVAAELTPVSAATGLDGAVQPLAGAGEVRDDLGDDFDDDADLDLPPPVADAPLPDNDPFSEDKPTVWTPYPPAPLMTMAERVEQAMARDADPFAEDRVTTSWQAPPASLLAATRRAPQSSVPPPPSTPAAVAAPAEPDFAAELAAQLMADPLLAIAPAAPAPVESLAHEPPPTEPLLAEPALDQALELELPEAVPAGPVAAAPEVELEASVFDRVTTVLPVERDEIAIAPLEPPRRITMPMASARVTSPSSPPPVDYVTDDLELAPRSGVGLGHRSMDRSASAEPTLSTDDVGPLERTFHRPLSPPPPAVERSRSDADELSLEDADILADVTGLEVAAAAPPPAPAALPLIALTDDDDDEGPASSRARTRDLRPMAPDEPEPALGLELEPALALEATATLTTGPEPAGAPAPSPAGALPADFDGAEARTVTIVPDLDSIELAAPGHGEATAAPSDGLFALAEGEDPFDLPTAPITPLPEPPVRTEPAFAIELPEPTRDERVNRAATLDLVGRAPTPRGLPDANELDEPTVAGGPRAKTLELAPTTIAPLWAPSPSPPPSSAPAGSQPDAGSQPAAGYQADTADLVPRFPTPPHDLAVPVAVTTPAAPSRDQVDTVDLGTPVPGWDAETNVMQFGRRLESASAWQPLPLPPVTPAEAPSAPVDVDAPGAAEAGDDGPADDAGPSAESLGARLSPAVLRGLGLAPMAEGATTDEPTRDGWPVASRGPATPLSSSTAPLPPAPPGDVPASPTLRGDEPLAMAELELPPPRAGVGTRTPSEVLLRSSAPEALAIALASELDRGAPATESPDDRSRRRITALLERASAAARAGEHPMAIAAIDLALSEAPDSAVAQKLVHRSRDIILDCYHRYFGDLSRRPVPVGSLTDLTGRPLDPRAAFLVSRMDGALSYEEILDVAGMGRLEACRHLAQLLVRGIIRAT